MQVLGLQVNIVDLQIDQFLQANTGTQEHFQDEAIPLDDITGAPLQPLPQAGDLRIREEGRRLPMEPLRLNLQGGILAQPPGLIRPGIEPLRRRLQTMQRRR